MPQANPQTKAAEAFAHLVDLVEAKGEPDEFSLARFERVARATLSVDPVIAHQILGVVASFRWDADSARAHFTAAVQRGGDAGVVANFGRAFAELNDPWTAADKLREASELEPENLWFLKSAIAYHFCAGKWNESSVLVKALEKRTQDVDMNISAYNDVILLAKRIGVRQETVEKSMRCALRLLSEKRVRVATFNHGLDDTVGEECVYMGIQVGCSDSEARALDDELTPRLFDEVGDLQLSSFVLSIEHQSSEHEAY